jgi:hypothetical protein
MGPFMSAEIKPYRISIGDDVLSDLESRLRNAHWPEAELIDDWSSRSSAQRFCCTSLCSASRGRRSHDEPTGSDFDQAV